MNTTSFHIMLQSPQRQQITLDSGVLHKIGVTTPVAQSAAKLTMDTSEHWSRKLSYVPACGEIIVYSDRSVINGINYPGIKIGDGSAYVVDLPFVGNDVMYRMIDILAEHINDSTVHVTANEKTRWNHKLDCSISGEILILERTEING